MLDTTSNNDGSDNDGNDNDNDGDGEMDVDVDATVSTRVYNILFVPDPSRQLSSIPKPGTEAEWIHVDLHGGQRYLRDDELRGFVFRDRSKRPWDLVPLKKGEVPVAIHEKVFHLFSYIFSIN